MFYDLVCMTCFIRAVIAQDYSLYIWSSARGFTYHGANGDQTMEIWEGEPFTIVVERRTGFLKNPSIGYNVFPGAPTHYGGSLNDSNLRSYYGQDDTLEITQFGLVTFEFKNFTNQTIGESWAHNGSANYSIFWSNGLSPWHFGKSGHGLWCTTSKGVVGQCLNIILYGMQMCHCVTFSVCLPMKFVNVCMSDIVVKQVEIVTHI